MSAGGRDSGAVTSMPVTLAPGGPSVLPIIRHHNQYQYLSPVSGFGPLVVAGKNRRIAKI